MSTPDIDLKEKEQIHLGKNESGIIMDLVRSNHAMSNNLMGICTAVMTFFLALMFQSGNLNTIFSQVVIALMIIGISSFGLSGFYYSIYEANFVSRNHPQLLSDIKKADFTMVIGLLILWLYPPMITLGLGIFWVTILGFVITASGIIIFFYEYGKHKIKFIVTNVYLSYLKTPSQDE